MSGNLNRSTKGFSKYDSMSIEELEEILRADAMGPERADTDVDEILYVMEVLAKKRRQNGIAGKTALEAYQEFQQHYISALEVEDMNSSPNRKATVIPFRRITTVAASLVLVFTLATSVNAFRFKDVWNAVVRWTEETFSFALGGEVSEPKADDNLAYSSFSNALKMGKIDSKIIPSYIPEGYQLVDIKVDETPLQKSYVAVFSYEEKLLKISVQSFLSEIPEQIEKSESLSEVISSEGIDYYFFTNHNQNRVAWIIESYECYISGVLSVDELKLMIDSIGKG